MPPGAPGALPVLPLGMCWQLQDGPDYHPSWGRGQCRLRRCGGVLWAFKRRKCVEIAKRALLATPTPGTRHLRVKLVGVVVLLFMVVSVPRRWLGYAFGEQL